MKYKLSLKCPFCKLLPNYFVHMNIPVQYYIISLFPFPPFSPPVTRVRSKQINRIITEVSESNKLTIYFHIHGRGI